MRVLGVDRIQSYNKLFVGIVMWLTGLLDLGSLN